MVDRYYIVLLHWHSMSTWRDTIRMFDSHGTTLGKSSESINKWFLEQRMVKGNGNARAGLTTRRTRRPPRAADFWGGNKSLEKIFLRLNIAPFSNLVMNGLNNERHRK